MNLNVDKSQWTKVRLGDVATEYSRRINDPSSGDRERFVGSSCIGQWDFRVQEWESTASVTSAMKLFEEGDYLLVRRSLYASDFRERAPRAHFAGVCSGDILTIRENPEFIADGFLIGILNNPSIWSYIVANASGSITRRIKWKDLANYEFLLPPKDQQAEIAELLWALDDLVSLRVLLRDVLRKTRKSKAKDIVFGGSNVWLTLEEICDEKISYGIVQAGPEVPGGMAYIKSSNIKDGEIELSELSHTSAVIAQKYRRSEVHPGDLVFSLRGNLGAIAEVPHSLQVANLTQGTARISVADDFDANVIRLALETDQIQNRIRVFSKGSTFKEISLADLRRIKIPVRDDDTEKEMLDYSEISKCLETAEANLEYAKDLNVALRNSLLAHV
jgi:restriction endonuclease S subunit